MEKCFSLSISSYFMLQDYNTAHLHPKS